jgi:pimeloyl-ACP methyl ester carboxylesterase
VYGEGPPVVLVHGLCGSTRWWARNVEALSLRHRVIAVDLAGFGESRGDFVLSEAAATLRSFLSGLGLARFDLIGHSMGGLVAAELAADFPDAVRKLVLVDAAGVPFEHGVLAQAVAMARAAGQIPFDLYPLLLGDTGRAGVLQVMRLARQLLDADVSGKLGSIAAPTLVVWGQNDLIVPLELGRRLAGRIPRARLAVLPETGHVPMWERPEAWNELVLPFLEAE